MKTPATPAVPGPGTTPLQSQGVPVGALKPDVSPAEGILPEVVIEEPDCIEHPLTRRGVLRAKLLRKDLRADAAQEARGMAQSPEKKMTSTKQSTHAWTKSKTWSAYSKSNMCPSIHPLSF